MFNVIWFFHVTPIPENKKPSWTGHEAEKQKSEEYEFKNRPHKSIIQHYALK
jgi:hypothetical protein